MVFQSGFTANAGHGVVTVVEGEDVISSHELNHASIIDGSRLSRATIKSVFRTPGCMPCADILRSAGPLRTWRKLLITDGVFQDGLVIYA